MFFFSLFIFLCCFPFCFPRCASLLWSPLYCPVALPRCWVEVLEPTVAKTDDLGLVPIFKKNSLKKSVIFIFSFDLHTDIILRQFIFKEYMHFFSLFSAVSRFVSPVVLPYCGPRCIAPLHYPVVGPKSSSQPLRKLMT